MASQQPLSARGLSRTVLTPPDILGERMQLEQLGLRRDALDASRRAKMPQPEYGKAKEFDFEGKYFTTAQDRLVRQYQDFMSKNAVEANEKNRGTPYFNEDAFRKKQNMERNLARFMYEAKDRTNFVNKSIEELDPNEIKISGFIDWTEGVDQNINKGAKFDELGNIVIGEDEQDVFSSEYLMKPESFYYKPVNWSKEALDEISESYRDVETGAIRIKQIDLGNVRNRARALLDAYDNKESYQKSFAAQYLQDKFGLDPRKVTGAVNTLVAEEPLQIGNQTITIEDVKDWAEDYVVDQVKFQADYTKTEDEDGGGFEINFGGAKKKFGGSVGKRDKKYFEGFNFFDAENEDAPLEWRQEEHDVYTPRPGALKMNIYEDGSGVTVRADVRDIVKIKDDVLAVTYMYSPTKGVYNNDTIYLRKGDPEYESLKSGMEGYDPFQFINDWKANTKGESVDSEQGGDNEDPLGLGI